MNPIARWGLLFWLLALSACSSGPQPLPECSGTSKPINRPTAAIEASHEDRSRG